MDPTVTTIYQVRKMLITLLLPDQSESKIPFSSMQTLQNAVDNCLESIESIFRDSFQNFYFSDINHPVVFNTHWLNGTTTQSADISLSNDLFHHISSFDIYTKFMLMIDENDDRESVSGCTQWTFVFNVKAALGSYLFFLDPSLVRSDCPRTVVDDDDNNRITREYRNNISGHLLDQFESYGKEEGNNKKEISFSNDSSKIESKANNKILSNKKQNKEVENGGENESSTNNSIKSNNNHYNNANDNENNINKNNNKENNNKETKNKETNNNKNIKNSNSKNNKDNENKIKSNDKKKSNQSINKKALSSNSTKTTTANSTILFAHKFRVFHPKTNTETNTNTQELTTNVLPRFIRRRLTLYTPLVRFGAFLLEVSVIAFASLLVSLGRSFMLHKRLMQSDAQYEDLSPYEQFHSTIGFWQPFAVFTELFVIGTSICFIIDSQHFTQFVSLRTQLVFGFSAFLTIATAVRWLHFIPSCYCLVLIVRQAFGKLILVMIGISPIVVALAMVAIFMFGFVAEITESIVGLVESILSVTFGDMISDFYLAFTDGSEVYNAMAFVYVTICTAIAMWLFFTSFTAQMTSIYLEKVSHLLMGDKKNNDDDDDDDDRELGVE